MTNTPSLPLTKYLLVVPSNRTQELFYRTVTLCTLSYVSYRGIQILRHHGIQGLIRTFTGTVLSTIRSVPLLNQAIDKGLDGALTELIEEIAPLTTNPLSVLPAGIHTRPDESELVETMLRDAQLAMDKDATDNGFRNGSVFGGIYHPVSYALTSSSSPTSLSSSPSISLVQYLQSSMTTIFLNTNQLYPTLFRYARKMEAEAVMMSVNLLKGYGLSSSATVDATTPDPLSDACGVLTSGGTESVLVSMKTYRDAALTRLDYTEDMQDEDTVLHGSSVTTLISPVIQANRDGIVLQVLAGISCHPALDKACHLLGLQLIKIPVDPVTKALNPQDIARLLTPSTLVVYASAPGFAHGIVDPVTAIGNVTGSYTSSIVWGSEGVPIHVDNCLGGVYLSFAYDQQQEEERRNSTTTNRYRIPAFDFRAHNQVKTISMDIHKYGNAPKGSSVVAFRTTGLRKFAYTAVTDFPGGYYTTPTIGGSRNGISGALAWSTLTYYGYNGYSTIARITNAIHQHILTTIREKIPGIQIVGTSHACIIAFTSAVDPAKGEPYFSPYSLASRMEEKNGWHLALLQNPPALHIVVTERLNEVYVPKDKEETTALTKEETGNISWRIVDQWLTDLEECAKACMKDPLDKKYLGQGTAAIYGAASILPGGEVKRILQRYCDILYMVR